MSPKQRIVIEPSTNPITGIINVAGEPDGGKTTFAFNSGAAPERTAFIDDDVKGATVVRQIEKAGRKLRLYHNLLLETKGMRELQIHNHCMEIIEEINDIASELDVLIWDPWTRFENTFQPMVAKNPQQFKEFYSSMGQIKGAEQWNASFDYEGVVLAGLQETVPLIILTSHLKKDAVKKDIAESKKPLIQKSVMRIWLRHSEDSPKPTALVLKRLLKIDFSSGNMSPVNVTHRKIKQFDWAKLLEYWENPVGDSAPSPEETPNEFEISILDGVLTKDQKDVLRLAVLEAEKQAKEEAHVQKMISGFGKSAANAVPTDAWGLIALAGEKYNLDMTELASVLELEEEEVMEIADEQIKESWNLVKEYAESQSQSQEKSAPAKTSKGKSSKTNGKRR